MTTSTVPVRFALVLFLCLCLAVLHERARAGVSDLVPKPVKSIPADGTFTLTDQTALVAHPGTEREAQQLAHQSLVPDAVAFDHIAVQHQGRVLTENQRPQRLLRKHDLREPSPAEVVLERRTYGALAVRVRSLPGDASEVQEFREAEGKYIKGETAPAQRRGEVAGQQPRGGAGHEHLDILGVVKTPHPPLPARNVLHFVKEKVAALAYGLRKHLPVAAQNEIQLSGVQGLEAVIFEVQVDQAGPADSLRLQALDRVEEKKGLPGTSNSGKGDDLP